MISDHTLDETLIELARSLKALKALRHARKLNADAGGMKLYEATRRWSTTVEEAAAKRASMDLSRKLSDLRQGR